MTHQPPAENSWRDAAVTLIEAVLQDIRYAARLLARNPLFALTAALSLAIGIGANTTIFTVAHALLFRAPAGVLEPDRLVDIGRTERGRAMFNTISYPNYLDVRRRTATLDGVYAYQPMAEAMSLGEEGSAQGFYATIISDNYFGVLGVRPAVGRLFVPGEAEQAGSAPIVVLNHAFWTRRFDRDPGIVGRAVQINGRPFTVVGVASEGFQGTGVLMTDAWIPVGSAAVLLPGGAETLTDRESAWLWLGGRLKPEQTVARAAAELETISVALQREYPDQNRGKELRVVASSPIPGNLLPVAGFLGLLVAMVSLVLVIACANVAGVLLARASARRREIGVRLAIGAARGRIIRQLLTETVILFLLGGGFGLLLARGMTSLLMALLPALPFPIDVSLALDSRAVVFTMGLSLGAALLSGLVPALQSSRHDVVSSLKTDVEGAPGRLRLRYAFVVAQVAFSLMLVVGAGLFVRALQKGRTIDPGFDPKGVELAVIDLSLAGHDEASGLLFTTTLVDRMRQMPNLRSASVAAMLPMGGIMTLGRITVPGRTPPDGQAYFTADWNVVDPGYFATLRIPLIAGRDFAPGDRAGAPRVAIIGEAAARQYWPGESAVGKTLLVTPGRQGSAPATALQIVGVARDVSYRQLGEPPRPFVYVPMQQHYTARMTIVARGTHGQRLAADLRTLVASMNPNLPILTSRTLEDNLALGLVPQRVAASVSASLGLVGVLLAAIGIYGVTAYTVTRRTREIGIRMALGAQRSDVIRMVLRQGMSLTAVGAAIGLLLSIAFARLLATFLFGIPPIDPLTFIGAVLLFGAIGLAACYAPARRATRIDATRALRID